MKAKPVLFLWLVTLALLAGCAGQRGALPEGEALALLESTQQVVLSLSRCPPQPAQGQEAAGLLRQAYGDAADTVWLCFFEDSLEETVPGETPRYAEGLFFPLIFHQDIELSEVSVRDGSLYLRESYTGVDPLLEGFSRTHVYVRGEDGQWVFDRLEGTLSVAHTAMNPVYLPMKAEYAFL